MWSGCRPTVSSSCTTRSVNSLLDLARPWMTRASLMMAPTVMRGLSEAKGSWKMICMSRRSEVSAPRSSAVTFLPSNQISPAGGDVEAHVIDGVDAIDLAREDPAPDREIFDEVVNAQQRLGHCPRASAR